ncbi:hypothetical protein RFI_40228, partial [Reticulomyxa filosa]
MITTDLPSKFAPAIAAVCAIIPSIRRHFFFFYQWHCAVLISTYLFVFVCFKTKKKKKEVKELNIMTSDNTINRGEILALRKCAIDICLNDTAMLVTKKSAVAGNVG